MKATPTEIGPPYWDDQPLHILGGGSSIRDLDPEPLRRTGRLLGCNRSAFYFNADILFTLDRHFVRMDRARIEQFIRDGGEVIIAAPPQGDGSEAIEGAQYIERRRGSDTLANHLREVFGTNSGFGALGLAWHKRAQEINLFGFDMCAGPDGATHCHGRYQWSTKRNARYMHKWSRTFSGAAEQLRSRGVRVTNYIGDPESLIPDFDRRPLSDWQERAA